MARFLLAKEASDGYPGSAFRIQRLPIVLILGSLLMTSCFLDALPGGALAGSLEGRLPRLAPTAHHTPWAILDSRNAGMAASTHAIPSPSRSAASYSLTFTETGLPAGTPWAVQTETNCSGGRGEGTTTSSIVFAVANGTYEWNVNPLIGYTYDASPSAGSVTIVGLPVTVSIEYVPGPQSTYGVTFVEQGLPNGTNWAVNLSGTLQTATVDGAAGVLLVDQEPNGTYLFTVRSAGYVANPSSGGIGIHGIGICQSVAFASGYAVTFAEFGLPSGTTWSVTMSPGGTLNSTGMMITFVEENGAYTYTVGSVAGYIASPSSGMITVEGKPVNPAITFTSSSSAPSPSNGSKAIFSGLPASELYALVGGVIVAVIAVALGILLSRRRRKILPVLPASPGPPTSPPRAG